MWTKIWFRTDVSREKQSNALKISNEKINEWELGEYALGNGYTKQLLIGWKDGVKENVHGEKSIKDFMVDSGPLDPDGSYQFLAVEKENEINVYKIIGSFSSYHTGEFSLLENEVPENELWYKIVK